MVLFVTDSFYHNFLRLGCGSKRPGGKKMARTWDLKLDGDQTIKVKALKKDAERVGQAIRDTLNIHQHFTEITGIIGGKEYQTTYYSPFGVGSLPAVIVDTAAIITQAKTIFKKHLPIVDNRKTLEEVKKNNELAQVVKEKHEAKAEAFLAEYCGQEVLDRPIDQVAIVLQVTFDDSDIQTDYFNKHASIGPRMLLGFVPQGTRKETVARRILGEYPKLCKLNWEWHTENYSGGHGNYLESEYTGKTIKHHAYNGRKEVTIKYEIRFDSYSRAFRTYKDYPGKTLI
jgi:hypothetical protein